MRIRLPREMQMEEDKKQSPDLHYDRAQLPDLLRIYYSWLFPYNKFYEWLDYDAESFSNREFSFTLEDDIYVRYQSFDSRESLEEGIKKARPVKIDIGAIFSHKPKEHTRVMQGNFKAERKELVFDIDMTDYDDIRTCCSGAEICLKCWKYMVIAIRILNRALKDDFGFSHLLWVYSGRRGVHCWVCDEHARELSQEARSAIAEYLTLVKGGEQQVKKVKLSSNKLHPFVSASLEIIKDYFPDIVEDQSYLQTSEQWNRILQLIPNKSLREELDREFSEETLHVSSWHRWQRIESEISKKISKTSQFLIAEIRLQFCYPRLDVNVTKGINHLLKSPLCVHPKTGRVCVPIDIETLDQFNPFDVPTVSKICHEFELQGKNGSEKKGYKITSLALYMKPFDNFLLQLKKAKSHKGDVFDF